MDREDLEDMLSDAIDDSMDQDWTSRVGARAIAARLEKAGLLDAVLKALPPYTDSKWDD